jgi:isopenicillin N synthase-like dioxygenase
MKNIKNETATKGHITLEYPSNLRKVVEETVVLWEKFCSLPEDVKNRFVYSNNSDGVGYELKNGIGKNADRKENFDITIAGEKWLIENLGKIDDPIALDFLRSALSLVDIMKDTVFDFALYLEKEYGISDFYDEVKDSKDSFFVRFIHYFGDRKTGDETASAHTDQSGFTFHLYESEPGLQSLSFNGDWKDMPVSSGETVIIPSMQLQLRSKGKLKALCHRVVATDVTSKTGRYSSVCFVQLKNTSKYDKEKHGRLQERVPGFNYQMSHEEFQKLFK